MAEPARQRLTLLRNGLLLLHKRLLDAERAAYERDVARITSSGQYLQLVLGDPWFVWLREISQFIVLVDEALASKEPDALVDGARFIDSARALLTPSENGSNFARHYSEAMQRDPDAVLAHGEMVRVFAQLDSLSD
jgi:hypothetical protein